MEIHNRPVHFEQHWLNIENLHKYDARVGLFFFVNLVLFDLSVS